jgi:hypothetical protein
MADPHPTPTETPEEFLEAEIEELERNTLNSAGSGGSPSWVSSCSPERRS